MAIHRFPSTFGVYITIFGCNITEFLLPNEVFRHISHLEAEVFVFEIEVFSVDCHKYCTQCRDYTVEEQLRGEYVGGWGSAISEVVDYVAACHEACLI